MTGDEWLDGLVEELEHYGEVLVTDEELDQHYPLAPSLIRALSARFEGEVLVSSVDMLQQGVMVRRTGEARGAPPGARYDRQRDGFVMPDGRFVSAEAMRRFAEQVAANMAPVMANIAEAARKMTETMRQGKIFYEPDEEY